MGLSKERCQIGDLWERDKGDGGASQGAVFTPQSPLTPLLWETWEFLSKSLWWLQQLLSYCAGKGAFSSAVLPCYISQSYKEGGDSVQMLADFLEVKLLL